MSGSEINEKEQKRQRSPSEVEGRQRSPSEVEGRKVEGVEWGEVVERRVKGKEGKGRSGKEGGETLKRIGNRGSDREEWK